MQNDECRLQISESLMQAAGGWSVRSLVPQRPCSYPTSSIETQVVKWQPERDYFEAGGGIFFERLDLPKFT
jgi:hypothetical protein